MRIMSIFSLLLHLFQFSLQMCVSLFSQIYFVQVNTFTWYQSQCTAKQKLHQNFLQVQKIEDSEKMEFQKEFILTPYNYFSWKEKIAIHLRSIGLYSLNMNIDTEPTSAIEKSKYLNQMNEALRTIYSLISPDLLFHISSCKTPNEAWTTLEGIFVNRMR